MIMIHRASTIADGDAEDLRAEAVLLETFENNIINIYTKKTGKSDDDIRSMLDPETWMDALTSVALGFADGIAPQNKAVAKVSEAEAKLRFNKYRLSMEHKTVTPTEVASPEEIATPTAVEQDHERMIADASEQVKNLQSEVDRLLAENSELLAASEKQVAASYKDVEDLKAKVSSLSQAAGVADSVAVEVPIESEVAIDPVEAFRAAAEAKDTKLMSELLKTNKAAIWAAR